MSMRLQELHPALVHFPIALLPLSIGADALGRVTGSRRWLELGRQTMPLAATGAVLAGAAGLVAQQEVRVEGHAHAQLTTHRNLNTALALTAVAMAAWRRRQDTPGPGYLLLGLAGLATMAYTSYLGGHMVYEHGVGVQAANGVRPDTPEITPSNITAVLERAASDVAEAVPHALHHLAEGEIAPALHQPRDSDHDAERGLT